MQNGVEMGSGSGFVFAVQESLTGDWYSYVLTAAHVIDYEATHTLHVKFYTNGIEISVPAERSYVDDTYDFAILAVPFRYNYAAVIAESAPKLFQKVYAAGIAVVEIPLCNPGELTGDRDDEWFVSAPANWGYSGGACMAFISGQWRAIGVIVKMGKVGDPTWHDHPVYHTIIVLKMDIILAKLEAEQVSSH